MCKAACCVLFEVPHLRADGERCPYLSKDLRCLIYDDRPHECQAYDCRDDHRIWLSFECQMINPDLEDKLNANT